MQAARTQAQLLNFLRRSLLLAVPFIIFYWVAAFLLWRIELALMAGVITAGSLAYLAAWRLALKGRLPVATFISGYAVLVAAALMGLILPELYAAYLLLCVLGVACVLPHARGWSMKLFLFATLAAMILVVLAATLGPPTEAPLPGALLEGVLILSVTCPAALICLLLWQYSSRMRHQLEHIQQSEQRFRSLAEATSLAVWITRPDGNPLEPTPDQQWLTGTLRGRTEGRPLSWLQEIHPDDRAYLLAAWKRALASREPYECEFRLLRPHGSTPMLARSVPVLEASGQVSEWISACADITERKVAEDALRFLIHAGTLLAASLELSTTLQSAGRLAIPRLSDWCLLDLLDEAGRWQLAALMHADSEAESAARMLLEQQGGAGAPGAKEPRELEPRALIRSEEDVLPGMEPRRVALIRALGLGSLLQAPLVARGRPSGVLTLGRTLRRGPFSAQDAILAEEMARRVAVAIDNAQLFRQSQEAVRARDDFLSIASHELRTPLTPLQIKLHSLHRRVRELARSPEAATWIEQQLAVIERQLRRLVRLIDEMLDISRLVGGRLRMDLEPVELAALVREALARIEELGEVARSKSEVRLSLPEEVCGRWDRLRMEQVISNLLSNALKYGQGRPIDVEVRREGAQARLVVRDRGIGIAPGDQVRVFGRFERAASVRHFGGFGLGLYIARQVVEAMGGIIHLESKPGEGSTFTVLLPLAGPAASQP